MRRGERRKRDVVFQAATLSEELWNYAQVESGVNTDAVKRNIFV